MKTIYLIIISIFCFLNCKAQTIYNLNNLPNDVPVKNCYYKDLENHFDNVVGTWRWENGNDSFELILQKFEQYNYPSYSTKYVDEIFGKYTYIENNVIISEVSTIQALPNFKVILRFDSPIKYYIIIKDVLSDKSLSGEFILNPNGTATLTLDTTKSGTGGGIYDPNNPPSPIPFSLPINMIMEKIE